MKVIGLTGGIGSGKTAATDEFLRLGADVIDADVVSRSLTAAHGAAIPAIREAFGDRAVTQDEAMDRPYIRQLVFNDPQQRQKLESILHPLIQSECLRQIVVLKSSFCILSIPLLSESCFWRDNLDRVLVIDAPEALQIERVQKRSGLTESEVKAILRVQISRRERLQLADDVIVNSASPQSLQEAVQKLFRFYQTM